MHLLELRLTNIRRFEQLELSLDPGWNLFVGANGAGKTTILEAAYLLSHGRSFRSGARTALGRDDSPDYSIFGCIATGAATTRLGLARSNGRLSARINGEPASLGSLLHCNAVVCFEPGTHELIAGSAQLRREFIDWGVFHVEQEFLACWRRQHKAMKQRNALLRQDADGTEFEPWEMELSAAAEQLSVWRAGYVSQLQLHLIVQMAALAPEIGEPRMTYSRGWADDTHLREALKNSRSRDRERGHTTHGPHRADWSLEFAQTKRREHLSRGQEKLVALACVIAQTTLHAELTGEWPTLCLDDVASELDADHQRRLVEVLAGVPAQLLVSGTELPVDLTNGRHQTTVFHVEHGAVRVDP